MLAVPVNCICLYFFCGPSGPPCLRRFFLAGDPDTSPAASAPMQQSFSSQDKHLVAPAVHDQYYTIGRTMPPFGTWGRKLPRHPRRAQIACWVGFVLALSCNCVSALTPT